MKVTLTLPDGYLDFLKERGITFEVKNRSEQEILAEVITGLLHTIYGNPKKPDSRIEWFVNAVQKVEKHSHNPEKAVLYCLSLERQCETLKELKQEMCKIFPVLESPNPEKHGYCVSCGKPMNQFDRNQGQSGLCGDCFDAEVKATRARVLRSFLLCILQQS